MKLTKVQARKLGGLITHGAVSFAGSSWRTSYVLKERGFIERHDGSYRPTPAGIEAYRAYTWNKTRRDYPEAAKAFDTRIRHAGYDTRTTPWHVWDWFLAGWRAEARR